MSDMEFDKFVKPLENSLDLWKQGQQMKKESAAKRKKDAEKGSNSENARLAFGPCDWSLSQESAEHFFPLQLFG